MLTGIRDATSDGTPMGSSDGSVLRTSLQGRQSNTAGQPQGAYAVAGSLASQVRRFRHALYLGDGGNDLCPALGLGPEDMVFPRTGFPLHKALLAAATAEAQVEGAFEA